jgi:hypothetical protein
MRPFSAGPRDHLHPEASKVMKKQAHFEFQKTQAWLLYMCVGQTHITDAPKGRITDLAHASTSVEAFPTNIITEHVYEVPGLKKKTKDKDPRLCGHTL